MYSYFDFRLCKNLSNRLKCTSESTLCRTDCLHGACSSQGECVCSPCFTGESCDIFSKWLSHRLLPMMCV